MCQLRHVIRYVAGRRQPGKTNRARAVVDNMTEYNNDQRADARSPPAAKQFPLLLQFSIVSLVAMISITAILVFLYRQDQLAEHTKLAAQNNEKDAVHLMRLLDEQIDTLVAASNKFDAKAVHSNPNIGLFTDALKMVRDRDIIKLKIFNLSGTTIYSSVKSEIGGTSKHPDKMAKALLGETVPQLGFRDTFSGKNGELRNVYVASVYMPLNHAGKRIGAIEVYKDVTSFFDNIRVNSIRIPLIVSGAFALLYAALFLSLLKTDRAVVKWHQIAARNIADLEQARLDAEQANLSKSAFLANMSHEIRTPMNGVIGMLEVLQQSSLTGQQVEIANVIHDSAFALLAIIDDILDFSKIEAGKLQIDSVPMSVTDVVEGVCEAINHMALKKGVELTLFTAPSIPEQVMGAPGRLRQILINLANNAVKFSSGQVRQGK